MEAGSALGKLANLPPVQQHRDAFTRSWPPFENARLKPALKFGQEEIVPLAQSAGPVFYPFSGPDFLNAWSLYPNHGKYVFFSLENPGVLPDTVVAYCDTTLAFPLFCEYAVGGEHNRRPRKELVHKRDQLVAGLAEEAKAAREKRLADAT